MRMDKTKQNNQMLAKMQRNEDSPTVLVGMQNGTPTVDNSLAVS